MNSKPKQELDTTAIRRAAIKELEKHFNGKAWATVPSYIIDELADRMVKRIANVYSRPAN